MSATRKTKLAQLVGAGLMLLASGAVAEEGGKAIPKTTISLGTATPGGGFPLYGNAFAEIMNAADPTLSIEPRNTKGSNENIPLLEQGQVDIALVAGEPSYEAFMGLGGRSRTSAKILTAMYSSPGSSWCAPTVPVEPSAISWASRLPSAPRGRGCRSCRATCLMASA